MYKIMLLLIYADPDRNVQECALTGSILVKLVETVFLNTTSITRDIHVKPVILMMRISRDIHVWLETVITSLA